MARAGAPPVGSPRPRAGCEEGDPRWSTRRKQAPNGGILSRKGGGGWRHHNTRWCEQEPVTGMTAHGIFLRLRICGEVAATSAPLAHQSEPPLQTAILVVQVSLAPPSCFPPPWGVAYPGTLCRGLSAPIRASAMSEARTYMAMVRARRLVLLSACACIPGEMRRRILCASVSGSAEHRCVCLHGHDHGVGSLYMFEESTSLTDRFLQAIGYMTHRSHSMPSGTCGDRIVTCLCPSLCHRSTSS